MQIGNKEFLNPQQQLYQNTKDIEEIKAFLNGLKWYHCDESMPEEAQTCPIEYTDIPEGTIITEGFLMDTDANIFRITGGDANNLLVTYWATIGGSSAGSPQLI